MLRKFLRQRTDDVATFIHALCRKNMQNTWYDALYHQFLITVKQPVGILLPKCCPGSLHHSKQKYFLEKKKCCGVTAFKTVNIINEQYFHQQKLTEILFRNNKHYKMLEGHCSCKSSYMLAIKPQSASMDLTETTLQIYSRVTYRVPIL